MLNTLKKAAVTLAATLGAVSASAHPYISEPHRHPHHPHQDRASRPAPSSYKYLPRHHATARDKCLNAIDRGHRLAHRFRYSNVGFIQGQTYACRVNLETGRLTGTYNLTNYNGARSYENAVHSSAQREQRKRHDIYRDLRR